jgi:hypothetical protein
MLQRVDIFLYCRVVRVALVRVSSLALQSKRTFPRLFQRTLHASLWLLYLPVGIASAKIVVLGPVFAKASFVFFVGEH